MPPPIQQLVDEYDQAVRSDDHRIAAEDAYALAMQDGRRDNATHDANAAQHLAFAIDDIATTCTHAGGIPFPTPSTTRSPRPPRRPISRLG